MKFLWKKPQVYTHIQSALCRYHWFNDKKQEQNVRFYEQIDWQLLPMHMYWRLGSASAKSKMWLRPILTAKRRFTNHLKEVSSIWYLRTILRWHLYGRNPDQECNCNTQAEQNLRNITIRFVAKHGPYKFHIISCLLNVKFKSLGKKKRASVIARIIM